LITALVLHTIIRLVRYVYKFPMPQFLANVIDNPLAQTLIRQANKAGFRLKRKRGNFLAYTLVFEKPKNIV